MQVEKLSRYIPSFWVLVGPVRLSIPLTSLNNWDLTINVPLYLLANSMTILLCMPTVWQAKAKAVSCT
eukprot:1152025-Pelagomonas_calceolata.AAC.3